MASVVNAVPTHLRSQAQAPMQAPVQAPMQAPVQAPVQANVQAPVQAPVQANVQPNIANAPTATAGSWLVANWLMCTVIVLVLLLVFIVGYVFFRTPAPAKTPPAVHAGGMHKEAPHALHPDAQGQPPAAPAAAPVDYEALLRRGQAALEATAATSAPAAPLRPDETSEEEILKLMQAEPEKTEPEPAPAAATTDEKKL